MFQNRYEWKYFDEYPDFVIQIGVELRVIRLQMFSYERGMEFKHFYFKHSLL